eukprot:212242_1
MGNKNSKQLRKEAQHKNNPTIKIFERISQNIPLCKQLRNEWTIQSKCIVFSPDFGQWICTNIIKIENKNREEVLTVRNGKDEFLKFISLKRYSNIIQPIYVCDKKEKK